VARLNPEQLKPLLILAALVGAWLIAPPLLKRLTELSFFEFQAPAWTASSQVEDIQIFLNIRSRSKRELAEAGRDLARVNAALELQNEQYSTLRRENAALAALAGLPDPPGFRYLVARVARREIGSWSEELLVRRGRRHGVEVGMGVVFAGGVVGRVVETGTYLSRVQLVSSPEFRIAGHFEGDTRPVTYQGRVNTPFSRPRGDVRNAPPDLNPGGELNPLRLVTSQLGGTFPEGLTIGFVPLLEADANGLFQRGPVALDPRILSLQEVALLIPDAPEAVSNESDGNLAPEPENLNSPSPAP
jgi:rod shape-determining protein MreC